MRSSTPSEGENYLSLWKSRSPFIPGLLPSWKAIIIAKVGEGFFFL